MKQRKINSIILHCSDSDRPEHDDVCVINRWHLDRGWDMVGYHYFIKSNGEIQRGRPDNKMGAHVKGHNRHSIGICLSGKGAYPWVQIRSAIALVKHLKEKYGDIPVYGHYQFNDQKQCPCMSMMWFTHKYNAVAHTLSGDVEIDEETIKGCMPKKDEESTD